MSRRLQYRLFGAAVLIIISVVGVFAYRSTQRLIENARQVAQTHQVLESLAALLSTLRDAESGQRAYLLTGDSRHLQGYESLQETAERQLRELSLAAESSEQQQRVAALRPVVAARFAALRESMEVRKNQGLPAAVEKINSGQGSQLMDAIEQAVQTIEADERRLLESRDQAAESSARLTLVVIGSGSVLAILLGILTAIVIQYEMSQRQRAEQQAQESKAQLQAIMDHSSTLIYLKDLEGRFVFVNQPCRRIFGLAPGKTVYDYFSQEMADTYTAADNAAIQAGGPQEFEEVAPQEDGLHTYLSIKFPLRDSAGKIYALCGVSTDITDRKRVERAMAEARETAERVSRFKDQFLSTMSHELRTPLNAILGFSELLADDRHGLLNDRQRRYVANVHTGGLHLLRLINDILDLSKIEAGRLELAVRDISLASVFQEVQEGLGALAAKKSLQLTAQVDHRFLVRCDPVRLQQILTNLAGNAIKFTPAGGTVALEARVADDKIEVSVRDTGTGIPPDEQKRIFEAFYRLRREGQHTEGTGLGLAITQRLVELHGDNLGVASFPGKGSRFYFCLPKGSQVFLERQAATPAGATGRAQVLVVEDDPVSAHLIESQLQSAGYSVVECLDPAQAVESAARLRPAAITLDLLMKPVSGVEILAALKRDRRTRHIPIIVVTIVDEPAAGSLLGADEYLVKPVEKQELLAAVWRCLNVKGKRSGPILVVEDHDATRETIVELLRAEGYSVAVSNNGVEARETVRASPPAAVVLDLLLPGVNGFELLAEWRADPRTEQLPVIVLTGKDLTPEEQDYLRVHTQSLVLKQQPWQKLLIRQVGTVLSREGEVSS